MKLKSSFVLAVLLFSSTLQAQYFSPDEYLQDYSREFSTNLLVHQRSIGFGITMGKILDERRTRLMEIEILNMRHPKEIRVQNASIQGAGLFTPGKLNMLYLLRGGMGMRYKLHDKRIKNSLEVNLNLSGGPVFGFVKPIYLEILRITPDNPEGSLTIERYDPAIHSNESEIVGTASMFRGFNDMQLRMGLWGKASISLDWGDYADEIKSLELGVALDAFGSKIPILAYAENLSMFPTCFVAMHFGSRW
jgi:hypothetical protein